MTRTLRQYFLCDIVKRVEYPMLSSENTSGVLLEHFSSESSLICPSPKSIGKPAKLSRLWTSVWQIASCLHWRMDLAKMLSQCWTDCPD
ncbi:hypothetical protein BJX68DRAFT_565 [Aspergillus pseudodeflectus]|uniref:Uncharacterized protein n=1 Tax=Aspergillus pseudodeflectus TaxID=176178 RepID=A0ABR4L9T0_9EURO